MTALNKNCTLMERLDDIEHKQLNLSGDLVGSTDCDQHRPEISVWAGGGYCDDNPPCVSVCIQSLWGQQKRYVDMSTDEARSLANMLTNMADAVDCEVVGDGRGTTEAIADLTENHPRD